MLCPANTLPMRFWQPVYIVMVTFDAEVLRQVDYLYILGHRVFSEELSTLSVTHTKEQHIHVLHGQAVGEPHIRFAKYSFMYIGEEVIGVTRTVDKGKLCFRVMQKHSDEFTRCIARTTYDTYFNHGGFTFFRLGVRGNRRGGACW